MALSKKRFAVSRKSTVLPCLSTAVQRTKSDQIRELNLIITTVHELNLKIASNRALTYGEF